nr:unnamed protein product [Digitaria exilis]
MKQVVTNGMRGISGWLLLAPLLAPYAPKNLPRMYFNLHLRRNARRLVPFLDPFVTIDIVSKSGWRSDQSFDSRAYWELKAYLTKECSRDSLEFCAEGAAAGEGRGLLLSLREGQEVTDQFQGVTVWWLLVPSPRGSSNEDPFLRLMFPQRHQRLILDEYLPHAGRIGRDNMLVTIDIVKESRTTRTEELKSNDAFKEVKAYLSAVCSRAPGVLDLRADGAVRDDSFLLSLRKGQEVSDLFRDVTLWWLSVPGSLSSSKGSLRLMFPQCHRGLVLDEYLPHVRREGRKIMLGTRRQRLYTNKRERSFGSDEVWNHVEFEHPATFDTLAMHPAKKRRIMEDLDTFCRNKDYYRRIGKPWKRGYLLYGPPGTGKSTMIAAMANHLKYDIYDIELTSVKSNSALRKLLVETTPKSIIVMEDIDCSLDDFTSQRGNRQGRRVKKIKSSCSDSDSDDYSSKVTLSGLLNFVDDVLSAQSGERIVVLTTNFPGKLDPALIRCGRMDMHVEMSYCSFEAFKMLARNYLDVEAHPLFARVEELLQVVHITPADVAEGLLPSQPNVPGSDLGVEACLGRLIEELNKKGPRAETQGQS